MKIQYFPETDTLAIEPSSKPVASTDAIFYADQRLWIPVGVASPEGNRNLYTYPDVMVVEKPLQLQSGRTDTVVNPWSRQTLGRFSNLLRERNHDR